MSVPKWFFTLSLFIEAISPLRFFLGSLTYAVLIFWLGDGVGALLFVGSLTAVFLIIYILKTVTRVKRRADALIQMPKQYNAFPSGHAAASAFLIPALAVTSPWGEPVATALVAGVITIIVILSRLTLRVHTLFQLVVGAALGVAIPAYAYWHLSGIAVEYLGRLMI